MADSKLKLSIVTALDNAGIKATKDQIAGLERQLRDVNKNSQAGFDGLNKKLQKMPGMLGDIVGSFGKVGSAIGYAYIAWETFIKGVGAGNKIFEQFGDGAGYSLESLKNGFSNLGDTVKNFFEKMLTGTNAVEAAKQANDVAIKNAETAVSAAEKASNRKIELMKTEQAESQKVVDSINRQTQAYMSQAQSLAGIKSAQGNADVLMLERRKFEERLSYERQGLGEVADQISKAYDVEIQRVKNKHAVQANDQLQRQAEQQAMSAARIAERKMDQADAAYRTLIETQTKFEEFKGKKGTSATVGQMNHWKKAVDKAQEAYDKAQAEQYQAYEDVYAKTGRLGELRQTGSNIRMQNQLNMDMAMLSYDNWVAENGNVGNFSFDKKYVEELNKAEETVQYAKDTAQNTADLAAMLEQLLKAKEN